MVTFLIVRKGVSIWTVHLMSVSLVPMYSTAFSRSKCWRFRIDMMETERLVYLSINFISRTSEFMTIFTLSKNGLSINKIRINFLSLEVSPYTLYQAFKNGIRYTIMTSREDICIQGGWHELQHVRMKKDSAGDEMKIMNDEEIENDRNKLPP